MSVLYCPHCGAKLEYGVEKPKFCSSCGASIAPSLANVKKAEPRSVPLDEEERVPNLSKLEYEVSFDASNKVTLGSLIQEGERNASGGDPQNVRQAVPEGESKKTGDDIVAESIARCKSARQPEDIGE